MARTCWRLAAACLLVAPAQAPGQARAAEANAAHVSEAAASLSPNAAAVLAPNAVAGQSPNAAAVPAPDAAAGLTPNAGAAAAPAPNTAALPVPETKPPTATEPFAFADFAWLPGNHGAAVRPLKAGPFTGELRLDSAIHFSFNRPKDNTIGGSSEVLRHGELQLTHLGVGGDVDYQQFEARVLLQLGLYSQATARNDASPSRGQWQLADAYRYVSEAYAGYHFRVLSGVHLQAGLFMSYVGLWSYYNFDNWTYQPSYVSSNTPWFFSGVRLQIYVTDRLKIEPWLVNGWQSYGTFNRAPGAGLQVAWRPTGHLALVENLYVGTDTLGQSGRKRFHSDSSAMVKYHHRPGGRVSQAAVSLTMDGGFESGGGVSASSQYFLGGMLYHRLWLFGDRMGWTIGGGAIKNPGRYLVLLPPINGATAASGSPYFTLNPRDTFVAWDAQTTVDFMPRQYATLRLEYTYRSASTPYFTGPGGVTPPGGNNGAPSTPVEGWTPDLRRAEQRLTLAFLLKL